MSATLGDAQLDCEFTRCKGVTLENEMPDEISLLQVELQRTPVGQAIQKFSDAELSGHLDHVGAVPEGFLDKVFAIAKLRAFVCVSIFMLFGIVASRLRCSVARVRAWTQAIAAPPVRPLAEDVDQQCGPVLRASFEDAASRIEAMGGLGVIRLPFEASLSLHGLYMQATEGDVQGRRPFWSSKGWANWNAWAAMEGLSSDEAMVKYIIIVENACAHESVQKYAALVDEMRACALGPPDVAQKQRLDGLRADDEPANPSEHEGAEDSGVAPWSNDISHFKQYALF